MRHDYTQLANSLKEMGHIDMAQLVIDYSTSTSPAAIALFRLGMNPKKIKIEHISFLTHLRCSEESSWKSLEELESMFPFTTTLHPKIPSVDSRREDNSTPRVSLAREVKGAVGSLGINRRAESYIAIYVPDCTTEVVVPFDGGSAPRPNDNRFYVHDAGIWGEVWSLRPVEVYRAALIRPGENIY